MDTAAGESRWRRRHGFGCGFPRVVRCPGGIVSIYSNSDPLDFAQSVRLSSSTRGSSSNLMHALCIDGVSLPEYKIQHSDIVILVDPLSVY